MKQDIRKRYEIGNNIRYYLMRNLQMTQVEFAEKIGIDYTYLNRIVTGRIQPSLPVAMLIAKELNEPLENVFYLKPKGRK